MKVGKMIRHVDSRELQSVIRKKYSLIVYGAHVLSALMIHFDWRL
jgi:hypothetical protein